MAFGRGGKPVKLRAGNAGLIASIVVALAATVLGAMSAYVGKFGTVAEAKRDIVIAPESFAQTAVAAPVRRDEIVRQVIERFPLERFSVQPLVITEPSVRPKIIIIMDDIGLDEEAADMAFALPGPITYSILPYAPDAKNLAARAAAGDGDVMLHLPMEPDGDEDPGPNALRSDMSAGIFLRALQWNLSRFDNYVGVNNHMGSKLTSNGAAMKAVLGVLKERGVFFIDSVTTSHSVAYHTGVEIGAAVLPRDVFLDPTPNDRDVVRRQLRLAEQIAKETGYVIAICHPRPETLDVLGPWLATVSARGFDLTTPSAMFAVKPRPRLAAAPELRF